jgi:hypothetical protein
MWEEFSDVEKDFSKFDIQYPPITRQNNGELPINPTNQLLAKTMGNYLSTQQSSANYISFSFLSKTPPFFSMILFFLNDLFLFLSHQGMIAESTL